MYKGSPSDILSQDISKSVLITNTLIARQNAHRSRLLLTNTGGNDVQILCSNNGVATLTTGLLMKAQGGAFQIDDNFEWYGEIYGIASGGTSIVTGTEIYYG
jgi:hypothetical protein